MIVLGLTGSIAMGKSAVAGMIRARGIPVFDADHAAHALTGPRGAALPAIETLFPGVTGPEGLDRTALGARVFNDPAALERLELLLHPMIQSRQHTFLARCARARRPIAVLDIPLLFETDGDRRMDAVLVVSAPARVQRRRALARPGMTRARFESVSARQMADADKRRRADYVIPTGLDKRVTLRALLRALADARSRPARAWPRYISGDGYHAAA